MEYISVRVIMKEDYHIFNRAITDEVDYFSDLLEEYEGILKSGQEFIMMHDEISGDVAWIRLSEVDSITLSRTKKGTL